MWFHAGVKYKEYLKLQKNGLYFYIHLYAISYKSISIKFLFVRIERYYLINRNSWHSLDIGTERKSYPSTFVICHTKVAEAFFDHESVFEFILAKKQSIENEYLYVPT